MSEMRGEIPQEQPHEVPPAPVKEAEANQERKLLNKEMTGAQAVLLLGGVMQESGKVDKSRIDAIAKGESPSTEKATKGSKNEREEHWNQEKYKGKDKMKIWEKDMNGFLDKYRGSDKEEFFKRIGIDLASGANAKDIYQTFMRDHDGDVGFFAEKIVQNNTSEQIEENRELIETLSRIYGENSAKVTTLLAEGVKNARTNPDSFTQAAQENLDKGEAMPGLDVIKAMQSNSDQWDRKQEKIVEERQRQRQRQQEEQKRQEKTIQQETPSNPNNFIPEEINPRLKGITELFNLLNRYPPTEKLDSLLEKYYPAIPMLTSIIAHEHNPNIPATYLSPEDVKKMKPFLGKLSRGLGKISQRYDQKFLGKAARRYEQKLDNLVEREARKMLDKAAGDVITGAEIIKRIPNPQEQLVKEVTSIYRGMTNSGVDSAEYLRNLSGRIEDFEDNQIPNEYPLLANLVRAYGISLHTLRSDNVQIAMPEITRGLESFLRDQGESIQPARISRPEGFMRNMAETFASGKLQQAEVLIPEVLGKVKELLPKNGPEFSQKIYNFAEYVTNMKREGKTDEEIVESIFK